MSTANYAKIHPSSAYADWYADGTLTAILDPVGEALEPAEGVDRLIEGLKAHTLTVARVIGCDGRWDHTLELARIYIERTAGLRAYIPEVTSAAGESFGLILQFSTAISRDALTRLDEDLGEETGRIAFEWWLGEPMVSTEKRRLIDQLAQSEHAYFIYCLRHLSDGERFARLQWRVERRWPWGGRGIRLVDGYPPISEARLVRGEASHNYAQLCQTLPYGQLKEEE